MLTGDKDDEAWLGVVPVFLAKEVGSRVPNEGNVPQGDHEHVWVQLLSGDRDAIQRTDYMTLDVPGDVAEGDIGALLHLLLFGENKRVWSKPTLSCKRREDISVRKRPRIQTAPPVSLSAVTLAALPLEETGASISAANLGTWVHTTQSRVQGSQCPDPCTVASEDCWVIARGGDHGCSVPLAGGRPCLEWYVHYLRPSSPFPPRG